MHMLDKLHVSILCGSHATNPRQCQSSKQAKITYQANQLICRWFAAVGGVCWSLSWSLCIDCGTYSCNFCTNITPYNYLPSLFTFSETIKNFLQLKSTWVLWICSEWVMKRWRWGYGCRKMDDAPCWLVNLGWVPHHDTYCQPVSLTVSFLVLRNHLKTKKIK